MGRVYVPDGDEFPATADVVVIGGGAAGVAAAFSLAGRGLQTILIERKQALGSLTTAGSSEVFRLQFLLPEHIAVMRAGLDLIEHFGERIGVPGYDIGLHRPGYLFLTSTAEGAARLRFRVEWQHDLGLRDVEYIPAPDLQKRFPYVAPIALGAAFRPGDGWFSVWEVCSGLARGCTARFFTQTAAERILCEGGRVRGVETNRGLIHAGLVVLASGPFAHIMAGQLGLGLPIVLYQQQEATVHHHAAIPADAPVTMDTDTAAFWRPEAGGGGMLSTGRHTEVSKPLDPVPLDRLYPAEAIEACSRLSPFWLDVAESLTAKNVSVRAGQMSYTPDKKAIVGPCAEIESLYLSVGLGGHGVMTSFGLGELLADLVTGEKSDADNPFSLRRFTEGWALTTEDMTFASHS